MKRSILLVLACSALTLRAETVINDNGTVTKDGANYNNASDALLNRHITSAEFMTALRVKLDAANAAAADAAASLAALQQQMTDKLNASLAQLQTALASATDDTQKAVIAGQIAVVKGFQFDAGKSPEQLDVEAKQAAADKAAADLAAAKAKLEQN